MKLSRSFNSIVFAIAFITLLLACSKTDQIVSVPNGIVQFEITDAPIDNAEISGAYITVSAISMIKDSNVLSETHTIDLLAYQQGNTKDLGLFEVPAGTYDHLEIQLNLQEDAFGNSPGCYIITKDSKKHNLYPSTALVTKLTLPLYDVKIESAEQTNILLDFDLRKLIKTGLANEIKYQFVEKSEMEQSIRVLSKDKTGMIKGTFSKGDLSDNTLLVFAYKIGLYNQSSEVRSYSPDVQHFLLAENSAVISGEGNFTIPFLEKGSYELVFAVYDKQDGTALLGILEAIGEGGADLQQISVEAGNQTIISGKLLNLLPI